MNKHIGIAAILFLGVSIAQEPPSKMEHTRRVQEAAKIENNRAVVEHPAGVTPPFMQTPPCTGAVAGSESYGFDTARNSPYMETKLVDGSIKREFPNGTEIIAPNGNKTWYPVQRMMMNAQPGTPPTLPSDPKQGRFWLENHNESLKGIIATYLKDNPNAQKQYDAREKSDTGEDLFKLIAYRTEVARFYAAAKAK